MFLQLEIKRIPLHWPWNDGESFLPPSPRWSWEFPRSCPCSSWWFTGRNWLNCCWILSIKIASKRLLKRQWKGTHWLIFKEKSEETCLKGIYVESSDHQLIESFVWHVCYGCRWLPENWQSLELKFTRHKEWTERLKTFGNIQRSSDSSVQPRRLFGWYLPFESQCCICWTEFWSTHKGDSPLMKQEEFGVWGWCIWNNWCTQALLPFTNT